MGIATASTTATTTAYAPYVEPVSGNHQLACVAIKWTDNAGAPLSSTSNSCKYVAQTMSRLSNGKLVYKPASFEVSVPFTHSSSNVPKAGSYIKQQLQTQHGIPATSDTHYILVNNNAPGEHYSYTEPGGNTSNLLDTLGTTFCHELGRQAPTILGSSGAYQDGKYVDQADGTTFMGHFASASLTASQLYYLGWLPNTQVALYDGSTPTMQFTLDPLEGASVAGDVKAVYLSNAANKPLFLSRPTVDANHGKPGKVLYTLHLASNATGSGPSNNRGSQRVTVFANTAEYAGLKFQVVSENGQASTISISPSQKTAEPSSSSNTSDSNKDKTKSVESAADVTTQKPILFSSKINRAHTEVAHARRTRRNAH